MDGTFKTSHLISYLVIKLYIPSADRMMHATLSEERTLHTTYNTFTPPEPCPDEP